MKKIFLFIPVILLCGCSKAVWREIGNTVYSLGETIGAAYLQDLCVTTGGMTREAANDVTRSLCDAVGLDSYNVQRGLAWNSAESKSDRTQVLVNTSFDVAGQYVNPDYAELLSGLRTMSNAQYDYLHDARLATTDEERQMAFDKRTLAYANLAYDTYQNAQERQAQHLAEKMDIRDRLLQQGYNDPQLALEIAGQIISIQKSKDFSDDEKQYLLSLYGFGTAQELTEAVEDVMNDDSWMPAEDIVVEQVQNVEEEQVSEIVESSVVIEESVNDVITYKIQVLARLSSLNSFSEYFSKNNNIVDVSEEKYSIGGKTYYQYTVGENLTLREATKLRKLMIAKGIKDAWIVGYKGEERIIPKGEMRIE